MNCPRIWKKKKKGGSGGGHGYNIVYYKGKYRIMDYSPMTTLSYLYYANCVDQHATTNIWNDHYGKHWDKKDKRPIDFQLLMNYPGQFSCPTGTWNWRTYYADVCE